jgi:hypothetical protein
VLGALAMAIVLGAMLPGAASGFEGGGRKPSEAPSITVGQHYTGQLNNHKEDNNYGGFREVAFYRLPPVSSRDLVTIDWHALPFTHESGFPICMILAQGINDFNWGSVLHETVERGYCSSSGPVYELTGSGTAQTGITVQNTDASSTYLEFLSVAAETNPSSFETFPYDFAVEPILHYLSVAPKPVKRVSANGLFKATALLSSGAPAPDGLSFNLSVTWPNRGVASYTGVSSGGLVSFQLALPETAYGKGATFVVSHPADGTYQAVTASKLVAEVAKAKATPCVLAEHRAQSLARQFKRLKHRAERARGATRSALRRKVRRVKRKLRVARHQVKSLCSGS